jgi:hypothetical protein
MIHKKVMGKDGDVVKADDNVSRDLLSEAGRGRSGDVLKERSGDVLKEVNRASNCQRHVLQLPDEVLAHIFSFLDFGTVQNILPFVCLRFDRVARGLVFNAEFHISCGTVRGGLQQSDLELVCRMKPHVKMMRINGDLPPHNWITPHIPRVIFDLVIFENWANLTHLSIEGFFDSSVEERLVALLRSGSVRKLQHVRAMLARPLSCLNLTYWDTPNLRTVQYRTGQRFWEFFPQNNFDALFRAPGNVTVLTLDWAPFTVFADARPRALGPWRHTANHFLETCGLHMSVQWLTVFASANPPYPEDYPRWPFDPWTLVNPWPRVTKLRVRPFVFENNDDGWVLQKFPSLRELIVEYVRWTHFRDAGEFLKDRLLESLGEEWEGSVCAPGEGRSLVSVTLKIRDNFGN